MCLRVLEWAVLRPSFRTSRRPQLWHERKECAKIIISASVKLQICLGCQWLVHGARDSHWDNSEISSRKYVMGNVVSFYSKCAHDCPMLIFCTLLRLHYTETMWPHSIAMGEYVVEGIIVETCARTLVSTHFCHFAVSRVHLLHRCAFAALHGFTQYIIIIVLYLVCLLCFYFLDFLVLGAAEENP